MSSEFRASEARRVLLVCMPMGLVQTPNLGISLLKPALERDGIDCDVRYLNIEMLDHFIEGNDVISRYVDLVDQPRLAELSASCFATVEFGEDSVRDALVRNYLKTATDSQRDLINRIAHSVEPFLDYCIRAVAWPRYGIVGFTSLFAGMTIPSAVLARRIKKRYPHVVTVLGGWNTGDEMGEVIAEKLHGFDFVLRGESDHSLPEFARRILAGECPDGIPGLVYRDLTTG